MTNIIFSLPSNNLLANTLANLLKIEVGTYTIHDFPDGETYIKIDSDVKDKNIILVCSLNNPNTKIVPLLFIAQTLRELGAKKICLLSSYLPYMRQDIRFKPGEAITSHCFANIITRSIDSLITVDPHLHRIKNISDIYAIPTTTLHATKFIARWISNNISSPLIVGPDEESSQWAAEIAKNANAPYIIVKKTRYSDRNVSITIPEIEDTNKTPVLVDDIISTGSTMCAVIKQLLAMKLKKPICIGIHALFNQEDYQNLLNAGAKEVISCNTIPHFSNKIDITELYLDALR